MPFIVALFLFISRTCNAALASEKGDRLDGISETWNLCVSPMLTRQFSIQYIFA